MKIKDIAPLIFEKVVIYAEVVKDEKPDFWEGPDFLTLYKGKLDGIPSKISEMEILSIGAARRGVLDIEARRV